jgi:hypothetical protein
MSEKLFADCWKNSSTGFWAGSTGFGTGSLNSWARPWTENHSGGNRFNRFQDRLNRFSVRIPQRPPAFGGSFIYPSHSLSSFTSAPSTISWLTYSQTRAFNPPLTPKIASPSIDWRTLGVRWSWSNSLLISSRFSLSLHLSSSSQTWILCGFVTLGTLCSLTDRGCLGVSKFVDDPKKFVSPACWAKLRRHCLDLGGRLVED